MLRFSLRLCYSLTLFLLFLWLFITIRLLFLSPAETPSPSPDSATVSEAEALPTQTVPQTDPPSYYLCLSDGCVVVYACDSKGEPTELLEKTDIYGGLLPESDLRQVEQGVFLSGQEELESLLEDLGG